MAEYEHQYRPSDAVNRPTTTQVLTVVTLLPLGGLLLCLAGITLTATLIGLLIAVPLFIIFSPILVPAVVAISLAVTGFITSGVFGITALSSVTWTINYFRRMKGTWAEQFDQMGRHVQDAAENVGQRVRESGHKAQDVMIRS